VGSVASALSLIESFFSSTAAHQSLALRRNTEWPFARLEAALPLVESFFSSTRAEEPFAVRP